MNWLAEFGGAGLSTAAVVALLLGLRHATDPDHLAAVSVLAVSDPEFGPRRGGLLGLSWGLGHAATLVAFGLPIILLDARLPAGVQRLAEFAVGLLIIGLAVRLLVRWKRGRFHAHAHEHDGRPHAHPHFHESPAPAAVASEVDHGVHDHGHEERLGRSPPAAFGIGLVHGVGGSAGAGILLVAAMANRTEGAIALLMFALGTALSMALVSTALSVVLTRGTFARRMASVIAPSMGAASLLFGLWYAVGAIVTG